MVKNAENTPSPVSQMRGIDARALAIEIVDGVLGYTLEFSGHPSAHAADYDLAEEHIRAALSAKEGSEQ